MTEDDALRPSLEVNFEPLASGEVICTQCRLAYWKALGSCSNCSFYGPPDRRDLSAVFKEIAVRAKSTAEIIRQIRERNPSADSNKGSVA